MAIPRLEGREIITSLGFNARVAELEVMTQSLRRIQHEMKKSKRHDFNQKY
jgi:hypothetical protein